ncbi:hypothetical protein PILCRDRAFT_11293 [Piloderma croceum F 1598]|uniref:DNA/RNA-binding domain-containing protein n=1 Tax=Piloderma croceum (strain F 1598) TaxID=765440 RepID=A0A0C3F0I6_PILCF|nr:hypothetical protein PILCRDRAFT_11293 [Piloderma croceum F 1598]
MLPLTRASLSNAGWLGALGSFTRYFMAVATVVTSSQIPGPEELTVVSAVLSVSPSSLSSANHVSNVSAKSSLASEKPVARIDDSPSPCIGLAAAKLLDVEPEMDGDRKRLLHHHLGLLSREKGGELRAVYHFVKSLTTLHSFSTSRESILPIWSSGAQQSRLSNPSTRAADLFVLLQGMLFTNIQLDDLIGTLACFLERLEMEGKGVEEHEWIMTSIVRRAGGFGGTKEGMHTNSSGVKVMVKRATTIAEDEDPKMDVNDSAELKLTMAAQASPATSEADEAASAMVASSPASCTS